LKIRHHADFVKELEYLTRQRSIGEELEGLTTRQMSM